MKSLIVLLLLISTSCLAVTTRLFRVRNLTINTGDYKLSNVAGTLGHQIDDSDISRILFVGMAMDTLTPTALLSDYRQSKVTDPFELEYGCRITFIGRDRTDMGGTMILRGTWDKAEFIGNCNSSSGKPYTFKGTGNKSDHLLYDPKEAGLRAKIFIDKKTEDYRSFEIIGYAIIDNYYEFTQCDIFLSSRFPVIPEPTPGAIIVGKDGLHCGIVDNEGTKFIHGNPVSKKVTLESMVNINKYFQKGVYYKKYPIISKILFNSFTNPYSLIG